MSKYKSENNEVSTNVFGGAVAMKGTAALAERMAESAHKDPRGTGPGDSQYLNFSGKRGVYEFGSDKDNIDEEDRWVVNVAGFEDGFICWKGGKPVATLMANFLDTPIPAPSPDEHGPFDSNNGEGWFQAKSMTLKNVETGEQAYFKINSISGVSVFADLQKTVATRMSEGEPSWPVVTLSSDSFTSGSYKNYKPVITIEGWLSDEQVMEALNDEDVDIDELMAGDESEPKNKKRKRRKL